MNSTHLEQLKKDVEETHLMTARELEEVLKIVEKHAKDYTAYVGACCDVHPLLIIVLKKCESFNEWKNIVREIKSDMRENNLGHLTGKVLIDCEDGLNLP